MATTVERYEAAGAYVRRAVNSVLSPPIWQVWKWNAVETYAAALKTEPYRNELARIEARWLRASTDGERTKVARDMELLADRTQETLPGAPQDRQRTNLTVGEAPTHAPDTSLLGEIIGTNTSTPEPNRKGPSWTTVALIALGAVGVTATAVAVGRRR